MRWTFFLWIIVTSSSLKGQIKFDKVPSVAQEHFHDVAPLSDEVAVAYGYGTGNIFKTNNHGKSWSLIYEFDSIYFEQIQFLDEKNGFIAGSPNKIFRTFNGGNSWLNVQIESEGTEGYVYGMYFESIHKGYVSTIIMNENGTRTKLYKTLDGGKNWNLLNEIEAIVLNLEMVNGVLYGSGNNVIIKNINLEGKSEFLLKDRTGLTGQIRDIDVLSDGRLIGVSFNGKVIRQKEDSWETIVVTDNILRSITKIKDNGLVVSGDNNKSDNNFFYSKDDGTTWEAIGAYPNLHRIKQSAHFIWVVGKEGTVLRYKVD